MRGKITKKPDFKYIDLIELFSKGEDWNAFLAFLEANGGINATDENGRTALINCICNTAHPFQKFEFSNHFSKKLIKLGIDINKPDFSGRVALHFCLSSKNDEILDILLKNPRIHLQVKPNLLGFAFKERPTNSTLIIKLLKLGLNPFEKEEKKSSFYEDLQLFDKGIATIGGDKIDVKPILDFIHTELTP